MPIKWTPTFVAMVKDMAEIMNCAETAEALDITQQALRSAGSKYGFHCRAAARGPKKKTPPPPDRTRPFVISEQLRREIEAAKRERDTAPLYRGVD